ncbi:MAG: SpoIID/LytB domain-containing protein [Bacteroidales bacterium]
MKEPQVSVGIMTEREINFLPEGNYSCNGAAVSGLQTATLIAGKIYWNNGLHEELIFTPALESDSFELKDVTIGVNFHWERKEDQRFLGALKLVAVPSGITAINLLPVEKYLESVISSEMSATASPELLKAHAVISRSWLLAQMNKTKEMEANRTTQVSCIRTPDELIRWYDREDHELFDVCADDHCQRYQGITRISTQKAIDAVTATRATVLLSDGKICDARFSKSCGGAVEEFQNCWEDKKHTYLQKISDSEHPERLPDLTDEAEAEKWIRSAPAAFCNTTAKQILSQVLNNYDQETTDFYRWKVEYTTDELSQLIRERSGIDFGTLIDLIPVQRGTSGRLTKLKIVGSKRTLIIGKELEIRRTLSPSHLYSSAFVVDKIAADSEKGENEKFILTGAGWGHGVGLCQIGAAVMSEKGYTYDQILLHYYIGATLSKRY